MKTKLIALFVVFCSSISISQVKLRGVVVDATQTPIPDAHIVLSRKGTISVSDEQGNFTINLDSILEDDILKVSAIGYGDKKFSAKYIHDKPGSKLILQNQEISLDEVLIKNYLENLIKIGIEKKKSDSDIFVKNIAGGAEVGVHLKTPSDGMVIHRIWLSVKSRNLEEYQLQYALYSLNGGKKVPIQEDILDKGLISSTIKNGNIEFQLEEPIKVDGNIFLSFEWLMSDEIKKALNSLYKEEQGIFESLIFDKCSTCSMVVEDDKLIVLYDEGGNIVEKIKLPKKVKKKLQGIVSRQPRLLFMTTKSKENLTFYKYSKNGKWHRYNQSVIAGIIGKYN